MPLNTPVLFIIFNRPHYTKQVFEEIRKAKPKFLYISADGPRGSRPDDGEKCRLTKEIVEQIDWDCQVFKKYNTENLGCRNAVSSAITWFFENVEYGIILEDDCVPNQSFFTFCQECLEKYKDDTRVFHINGTNNQMGWQRDPDYSYYFSRGNSIWGWASWRRAWKNYDVNMALWPEIKRKNYIFDMSLNRMDALNRIKIYDIAHNNQIDTWDFQWTFTIQSNNGLCIVPNNNLITNIGFDAEATHTTKANKRSNMPSKPLAFPLKHPKFIVADRKSDLRNYSLHGRRGYVWRAKNFYNLYLKKG